ncbi:eukaryotic porin, putative [Toxoplasma gondii ME49]|uniref:Eukaryotic porin domain-containing protein n=4 Tax=Toxoplasma gondii TaxID=5811 RepID=B6KRZ3_TOXGV|nr:eukaryotic porin, putative [Toxoplasma gondii ME49]EPT24696.1 eukaryotic porin, putative [Toxoplasma gondii ME49]ESS28825.1 putative eukaryotic porin [Toxoplasma gondii VEG]PIM04958.1 putative eukaryotic porin [Toxoplasma gondii COUG]CEL78182.1 TPA: eukaryotic porin domain-containing protein [Toxoplasma gondii VEG]|eukprot:XP_002370616.1 eukaryotic porin, putative [Toxoplasma gondii ME49]
MKTSSRHEEQQHRPGFRFCRFLRGMTLAGGDRGTGSLLLRSLHPGALTGVAASCAEKEEKSFLSGFPSFGLFDKNSSKDAAAKSSSSVSADASTPSRPASSGDTDTMEGSSEARPPLSTAALAPGTSMLGSSEAGESTSNRLIPSESKELDKTRAPIPVPYEQFSREWMAVAGQDNFDGFRLEATKQVNKVLTANHTFMLGTQSKEGGCSYSFGPTLVIGEPDEAAQQEGQMPNFFGMARMNSDGFLQARFIKAISKTFDIKFNSNSSISEDAKDKSMYEVSFDKMGSDWAANLKLAWQGTWILNGLFSQVITPKLQLGGELTWVAATGISMGSVGARYGFNENNTVTCQIGVGPDFSSPMGFANDVYSTKAQYVRKVTDRLSMGTELEFTHPDMSSAMRVGWQYLFRQARVQGLVDTAGRVSMFAQDYNGFGLSGMIDYWHGDYKFGFQMNVVPPPPQAEQPPPM